jgi:p-methyltransferase
MMDCILVGYNEPNVAETMARLEKMKHVSAGYNALRNSLVRFRGLWRTYTNMLNMALTESTGKKYDLHTMDAANLALCYLKTFLTRRQLDVEIVNFFNKDKGRLTALLSHNPKAVVVSTTFYNEDAPIKEVVAFVKSHNAEIPVIAGGNRISTIGRIADTVTMDYLLEKIGADIYVIDDQGEETLACLLHQMRRGGKCDLDAVPNLIYRKGRSLVRTTRKVENNEFGNNMIDWNSFPREFYTPLVYMRTSRGCAFTCSFCQLPLWSKRPTYLPVNLIEREMKELYRSGVKYISFTDDSLNVPLPRFKEMLRMMIANRFDFRWMSYFRCANADEETFDLMKQSGCLAVRLGIESGDQRILNNMDKHVTLDDYQKGMRHLHERGIITDALFIVGFPGETAETVRHTVEFIEQTCPTYYHLNIFQNLPDTPIHKQAENFGLKGHFYSWRHDTMDWKKACDVVDMMYGTIKNSTHCTYDMNSRTLLYLIGRGISSGYIQEFLRLLQPIMMLGDSDYMRSEREEEMYRKLLELGRKMAMGIAACGENK